MVSGCKPNCCVTCPEKKNDWIVSFTEMKTVFNSIVTLLGIVFVYFAAKLTAKWTYKAHVHSAFIGTLGGDRKKNPNADADNPQGISLDEIVSRCRFDPEERSDFTIIVAGIENLPPAMRKETLRDLKISVCEKVLAYERSSPSVNTRDVNRNKRNIGF